MKTLVAFCALVACSVATPSGLSHGSWGSVSPGIVGVNSGLVGVNPGIVGVNSGLLGVNSRIVGVNSGLVGVNSRIVGVNSGLVGVNPGLVGVSSGLVGLNGLGVSSGIDGRWASPVISQVAPSLVGRSWVPSAPAPIVEAAPQIVQAPISVARISAPTQILSAAPALSIARNVAAPAQILSAAPAVSVVNSVAPVVAKTVAVAAPVVAAPVTKTQWHAQTEHGQASYGHSEPLQTHTAHQDAHGNKVGSFSYLNPHDGQVHRTDYVADANGYRVAANDLPVSTSGHLSAVHLRRRRSLVGSLGIAGIASPLGIAAPLGIASHVGIASPLSIAHAPVIAAPAHYSAIQTTIVNNPGHAVSYRVD